MSITDELREWWVRKFPVMDMELHKDFTAIADRIDAEHERFIADAELAAAPTEAQLDELGWVRGPLDANGEMWHCGDMSDSNWGVIEGIAYEDGRWLISGHDTSAPWIPADSINHYHAPTVEDVLEEFADRVCNSGHQWGLDAADTIAEFAAKLQLREVAK